MIIPQLFYNLLLLAGLPAALLAILAGFLLWRKGRRAGAAFCGLIMLAGVSGFLLSITGVFAGDEMANGFSFAGERLTGEQMDALSDETVEWLNWYSRLSPEEQLAVSYVPADLLELLGYSDGDSGTADAPAGGA